MKTPQYTKIKITTVSQDHLHFWGQPENKVKAQKYHCMGALRINERYVGKTFEIMPTPSGGVSALLPLIQINYGETNGTKRINETK